MSFSVSNGDGRPVVASLTPPAAIAGGELVLRGTCLTPNGERQPAVLFGEAVGRVVVGSSRRVVVRVPDGVDQDSLVIDSDGLRSDPQTVSIGVQIAESLHPVSNPAVDAFGNIFVTRSGGRGEKVPVSIFKVDTNFEVEPFVSDIINPTGLLVAPDGNLLVSGRNNGTIYSVSASGQIEIYAEGMGVATGIALDNAGNLFVGDRTGTIFKIAPDRQIFVFATLEPSISAYHLAMSPTGDLFVSGPTTSSFDAVYKIDPHGEVSEYRRGFGRPQGLVFDEAGRLYVAASYRGGKGVFRIPEHGEPEQVLSGPGVVGLAFLPDGRMIVATSSALYRVSTSSWINH